MDKIKLTDLLSDPEMMEVLKTISRESNCSSILTGKNRINSK